MSEEVLVEVVRATPGLTWAVLALVAFIALRSTILAKLGQVSNIKASGVELTFAERLLDEAAAKGDVRPTPSAADRRATMSRLEHALQILKGAQILWVDDHPDWNQPMIDLFRQLKMTVDIARSSSEALSMARSHAYHLVITDMRRDTEQPAAEAGTTLISMLREHRIQEPVIVFAAKFDPSLGVHPAIFAYTNVAEELVHLVIDVMERVRFRTL